MSNCIRGGGIKLIIIKLYSSARYSVFRARCFRVGYDASADGSGCTAGAGVDGGEKCLQSFGVKYLTGEGEK